MRRLRLRSRMKYAVDSEDSSVYHKIDSDLASTKCGFALSEGWGDKFYMTRPRGKPMCDNCRDGIVVNQESKEKP